MELEFQTQQKQVSSTTKQRDRNRSTPKKSKFVGVRQRPSGKWVAEIKNTSQKKIRMWLGTFDTAEEAARAYDEAACLLRGTNTRTNFVDNNIPPNSALSLKIKNLLNQKKHGATQKTAAQNTTAKVGSYSGCNITSPSASSLKHVDIHSFDDDAYKPDLSNFNGGIEMGSLQFDHSSSSSSSSEFDLMSSGGFHGIFTNQENGFEVPKSTAAAAAATTTSEDQIIPDYFEKMKVERQISASLYGVNNESWENVDDCSGDAFWDLPMLCQMFYLS